MLPALQSNPKRSHPLSTSNRPARSLIARAGLIAAFGVLMLVPAAAHAGTAVSTVPNLPSGARAGGTVLIGETGVPGHVIVTQTFNGADFGATARVAFVRVSLACGPGPSPGNPGGNGPAINTPEAPCTNPDIGVFGGLSATGTGSGACNGTTFSITAPDSQGMVDFIPTTPVFLTNGASCDIAFTFSVLKAPTKDTFPNATGVQTTSVSATRSEIVANPGNPAAVGLQAAGLGSGDAVLVAPDCTTHPNDEKCKTVDCKTNPKATGCSKVKGKKASSPKLKVKGTCVTTRLRASVSGTGIKKVTYMVDGRVLKVVKRRPWKLNTVVRNLAAGRHRLTATITFKAAGTAPRVMAKPFARCSAPNFTG